MNSVQAKKFIETFGDATSFRDFLVGAAADRKSLDYQRLYRFLRDVFFEADVALIGKVHGLFACSWILFVLLKA